MPGALTWDPTPAGGSQSTARGGINPAADGANAALMALVSADGNQPSATLAATVGTPGQVVKLSDGADKGVSLVWAIPSGSSAYAWCWQIYPQAAY